MSKVRTSCQPCQGAVVGSNGLKCKDVEYKFKCPLFFVVDCECEDKAAVYRGALNGRPPEPVVRDMIKSLEAIAGPLVDPDYNQGSVCQHWHIHAHKRGK